MRGFAEAFAGYDAIVTPSPSCAGMVRENHALLARGADDPVLDRVEGVHGPRTLDVIIVHEGASALSAGTG